MLATALTPLLCYETMHTHFHHHHFVEGSFKVNITLDRFLHISFIASYLVFSRRDGVKTQAYQKEFPR